MNDLLIGIVDADRVLGQMLALYYQIENLANQIQEPPFNEDDLAKIAQISALVQQFYDLQTYYRSKMDNLFLNYYNPCLGEYKTGFQDTLRSMTQADNEMTRRIEAILASYGTDK